MTDIYTETQRLPLHLRERLAVHIRRTVQHDTTQAYIQTTARETRQNMLLSIPSALLDAMAHYNDYFSYVPTAMDIETMYSERLHVCNSLNTEQNTPSSTIELIAYSLVLTIWSFL